MMAVLALASELAYMWERHGGGQQQGRCVVGGLDDGKQIEIQGRPPIWPLNLSPFLSLTRPSSCQPITADDLGMGAL